MGSAYRGVILDTLTRLHQRLADRYDVERELGRGGMATVFLARDIRHARRVAIKVLHPELAVYLGSERFEREIRLAASLQHPHILGLIDSGEADGLLYYVMPFIEGESLRDRLAREGQLPLDDAVQIALEVADALGHAHAHGVIHRDIKPDNILLSGGHALVMDFGIARAASEGDEQKLTQTGMSLGTPSYMAPEQAVGDQVGNTADIYSLACVLYEMLAGEPPFTAKSPQALMARHSMEAVPSIRIVRDTVPEEIEDAIFAGMAKVPADRPKDAAHFAEMLGLPLGATASRRSAIRHTASRRVPTASNRVLPLEAPWWRRPWVLGAAALVVVGVAFASWKLQAGASHAPRSADYLAKARKIAVLYFTLPGADSTLNPVADGLTEALIRSLKDAKLDVISRNGVAPYRDTEVTTDSIARALQVGTLIQGSIVPEGADRVRVTTWLTDAFGNDLGRRTNFVISRDSLVAAEDAVASAVSQKLREQLGLEFQLVESQARTSNTAAWTLLQRAEKLRKDAEHVPDSDPAAGEHLLGEADSLLALAAGADSRWIDPVIARGEVALRRAQLTAEKSERARLVSTGMRFALAAREIDGTSAKALALRGTSKYAEWRLALTADQSARAALLKDAETDLQNAVTSDPTLAAAYATLSFIQHEKKDVFTALIMARNAYNADAYLGNSEVILYRLFWAAYNTEQFAEASKWCDEAGRRFPSNHEFTACRLWLMLAPDAKPEGAEAWKVAARMDSLSPAAARGFNARLAQILVAGVIGKRTAGGLSPLADSARRMLSRARTDGGEDPTHELRGYEAVMRAQMGDVDEAIALLKEYVAANPDHSFTVGGNIHWWWRDLRNSPGFQALLAQRR
ncbi:MAG TPA: serine/threonine-protein kinase [Gemmatimonadales bacterium]|nr:serine/threonine-protein kinase [Gemmatimonadales bacterium]